MTILVPSFDDAIVVREADAEVLGLAPLSTRLLADSNATGGALTAMSKYRLLSLSRCASRGK